MPPWIDVAMSLMGTKEVPGAANNPKIIAWSKVIGGNIEKSYIADSIPWCGLFVAYCLVSVGIPPVTDALWALNWRNLGEKQASPSFGSVFTMSRQGGGHTGFAVSQDKHHWHILGGNQGDSVTITKIVKSPQHRFNFPLGFDDFKKPLPFKEFDGKISHTQNFQ